MAAPLQVTIDLKNKPNGDPPQEITYDGDLLTTDKKIKVTRTLYPPSGSAHDFYRYTHVDSHGGNQPFELAQVLDDQNSPISGIQESQDNKVTSVSAYYWKHENGGRGLPSKALLVELVSSTETKYYRNSQNGTWTKHKISGSPTKEDLELLNCEINYAVTIDLSFSRNNGSYCCKEHGCGREKVSVSKDFITVGSSPIPYLKHEVDQNSKVAAIKYNDGGHNSGAGTRKNITLEDVPNLPNLWCQGIYTFYCSENDPVLIYVDSPGQGVNGWYQKGSGDESQWVKTPSMGINITPEILKTCSHNDFNDLVRALNEATGCGNLEECKPPPPSPLPAPQADQITGTEPFAFATLGYALSGTLAGSAATFFGGWKLYNRYKGDPWVRQI
ncbi:hypothetical protein BEWA_049740 [Theileria equi strain WA]|uniref:Uncharacterized protein n=1 Tax=Theileria equi strain WA TaxID=1537102 RepID=L1LAK5_THEEQ|nr:hypothetical protein BEWA_049740 [Theileria equi strain WA]EKX72507.1 hypothetical protein BEWA_049740 [Theileria equi strain WA]|eukprot:XP_004831959.1 hypothetical protein BEWA_049740 [Theileria equi strain WA]